MQINQITIDLNQLTELEIVHILLRLGMRQRICCDQFYRKKHGGFGILQIKKFNKACGGKGGRSGQLPSTLFDTVSSGYWHSAPRQIHAAVFWQWWLTARATMEFWPAFIAAWTNFLQSVDSPEFVIERAFHLTQQQLDLVACRTCGRKLLRAAWEARRACPVCTGQLALSVSRDERYKHIHPSRSRRVELFLEGIHL